MLQYKGRPSGSHIGSQGLAERATWLSLTAHWPGKVTCSQQLSEGVRNSGAHLMWLTHSPPDTLLPCHLPLPTPLNAPPFLATRLLSTLKRCILQYAPLQPSCVLHHLLQSFFYLFLCKHLPNLKVHPDLFLDFQSKFQTRTRPAYSSFHPKAVLSACVPTSGTRGPGWSLYCRCLLIDLHPWEVALHFLSLLTAALLLFQMIRVLRPQLC